MSKDTQITLKSEDGATKLFLDLNSKIHNYVYQFTSRGERLAYLDMINYMVDDAIAKVKAMSDEERLKTDNNLWHLTIPLFKLAYYGENITQLGKKIIYLYRITFKELIEAFETLTQFEYNEFNRDRKDKRIRVLFVSDRLGGFSSVMRDRVEIILGLANLKEYFTVGVMTNEPTDHNGKLLKENVHLWFELKRNTFMNIETIGRGCWDVVVYCDCHMGQFVSTMALVRLAPFQLTTFGHSESSFCLDGYITSKWFEPENYLENYGEPNVFVLNSLNMKYPKLIDDKIKENLKKDRFDYGLTDDQHVYLSTSSLFKIGCEMLDIFEQILIRDLKAVILITKMSKDYDRTFMEVLSKRFGPRLLSRIRLIDRMGIPEIYNMMKIADIILESYPFGNLNTTLECFNLGVPTITMPTNKLNGRFTFGLIAKMIANNPDDAEPAKFMIADDKEDYIQKAIRLASCKEDKEKVINWINKNVDCLFKETESLNDWVRLLAKITNLITIRET